MPEVWIGVTEIDPGFTPYLPHGNPVFAFDSA